MITGDVIMEGEALSLYAIYAQISEGLVTIDEQHFA